MERIQEVTVQLGSSGWVNSGNLTDDVVSLYTEIHCGDCPTTPPFKNLLMCSIHTGESTQITHV